MCRIRASADCYLTVVAVDPVGDVTLLLPNKWQPESKLRAGQTMTIPQRAADFEFYATPPHGQTVLKAIATRTPLALRGVSARSLASKGLVPLGKVKAVGVRQRTDNTDSRGAASPGARAGASENAGEVVQFTEHKLEESFDPDDWATAIWKISTRPR